MTHGSSILSSATREFLLIVTSRFPFGPATLPVWNPINLLNNDNVAENKKV